jgi:tRNA (guanine37-N1)-methyltransferase
MNSEANKPHFAFVTLFPHAVESWLTTSILGRAAKAGVFTFETVQLRDYSADKHRSVDDTPYGGGGGMVLRIEPLVAAVEAIRSKHPHSVTVYFSPKGKTLNQGLLESLCVTYNGSQKTWILICGHYEGVDERFVEHFVDLEISLGDFVLTGGELPAVAFADALIRNLSGTLASQSAVQSESFSIRDEGTHSRLLEYPHYTRPPEFRGHTVPDVLLSGDHARIAQWRMEAAQRLTRSRRRDLME